MLKANDYGKILTLESFKKIRIDDLVRQAKGDLKRQYLESVELDSGRRIDLVTSGTRYGGLRYWFACPGCQKRVGVLYQGPNGLGCRKCMGYRYRGSRYRGMRQFNSDRIKLWREK